jgi:hypothetical protein
MQFGGVIYSDSETKPLALPIAIRKKSFSFVQDVPVLWWDLNQNKAEL